MITVPIPDQQPQPLHTPLRLRWLDWLWPRLCSCGFLLRRGVCPADFRRHLTWGW